MRLSSSASPVRAFRGIADRYLEAANELFPERASRLGLEAFNSRLGKNDPASHLAERDLLERSLAAVENLPESAFHGDDWLDRRAFLSLLRTDHLFTAELPRWRDNPQTHCDAAVESIFDLVTRHAGQLRKAAPAIEARLAALPDFLAAGAACLRKPVPLWTKLAVQACAGAAEFLTDIEGSLAAVSPKPRRLRSLLASARRAFADYAAAAERKTRGLPKGYAIGRSHFEFLVREKLGMDASLPSLRAEGLSLIEKISAELRAEAVRLGWKNARQALDAAAAAWLPDRPLIDLYRDATAAFRKRVAQGDFAEAPPNESLEVLPAPAFLRRQFPTAAYSAPPPFSSRQQGIFWVNDLSQLASGEAARRAEIRQHFGVELTSVHEAYPGHHLQFSIQNRHPSKLRRLFAHAIFYEGWTMWCEKQAVELGWIEDPAAKLQQLHDSLWRAHRIVIDCGLHSGELSPSSAARQLVQGLGFTPARAIGDVNWYTSAPTVPMSYLLGRLEVEKLHRRFVAGEGWTLRRFHDWMLSHGALPWSWISLAEQNR